jgi:diguanylate cyclase (GGDEF)-like protein
MQVGPVEQNRTVRLTSSHLITTCATIAALLLFVGLGARILPPALGSVPLPSSAATLQAAFLLNIAIILFGWRRSRDLGDALSAWAEAERIAQRNANIDHTTGLVNRREFMHALSDQMAGKREGVLLFLDLDHFKRVNDLHGHLAGDQLLCAVADALRAECPEGACVARMGGDEFALLLPGATRGEADERARALLSRLAQPVRVGSAQAHVTASIGLAHIDGTDGEAVLRRSDVALYAAKAKGRNGAAWFDTQMERELTERLKLEEDIRAAIAAGEFVPFFQPLIELSTRELAGFEALARWRSPTRGLLEPDAFIEAAEASGLIGPLTISVMEQALKEARNWPAHLKIAVNVSPVQFRDPNLAEQILRVLTVSGFPADRLELEITEGALLEDKQQVSTIIRSLKAVGVRISLDDFGTGYASLAQLDDLPVDRVKIDRSFIATFVKSERTAAIVNTIATMGHKLNVPITAEGVETEWVRNELSELGCTEAQGWLFGRAVSADAVRSFLGMGGAERRSSSDKAQPEPAPDRSPARKTG